MAMHVADEDELRADINVTPLVDVMLVLLVIFIVVTPLLKRDVPVDLPLAETSRESRASGQVTLTAIADGRLLLDGEPLAEDALEPTLSALYAQRTDKTIFLAADRSLVYDRVVALMDACRAAGVERIGVVTGAEKKPAP
jgi:biopolymer transport protein ExbD